MGGGRQHRIPFSKRLEVKSNKLWSLLLVMKLAGFHGGWPYSHLYILRCGYMVSNRVTNMNMNEHMQMHVIWSTQLGLHESGCDSACIHISSPTSFSKLFLINLSTRISTCSRVRLRNRWNMALPSAISPHWPFCKWRGEGQNGKASSGNKM